MTFAVPLALMFVAAAAVRAENAPPVEGTASPSPQTCKYVVSVDEGAKPYRLCMSKAEWAAKKLADAKNPNRKVCRYDQASGTRFRSHKICMTAAEWENQRQLERQAIDNLQRRTCVHGGGC